MLCRRPGNENVSTSLPDFHEVELRGVDGEDANDLNANFNDGRLSPLDLTQLQTFDLSAEVVDGVNEGMSTHIPLEVPPSLLLSEDSTRQEDDPPLSPSFKDVLGSLDSKVYESLLINPQELPPVFSPDRSNQPRIQFQHSSSFNLQPSSRFCTFDSSRSGSVAALQSPTSCDSESMDVDPSLPDDIVLPPPPPSLSSSDSSSAASNHRNISLQSSNCNVTNSLLLNVSSGASNSSNKGDLGVRTVSSLGGGVSSAVSGSVLINNSASVWTATSEESSSNNSSNSGGSVKKLKVSESAPVCSREELSSLAATSSTFLSVSNSNDGSASVKSVDIANKLTSSSVSSSILRTSSTSSTVNRSGHHNRHVSNSSHSSMNNCRTHDSVHVRSSSNGNASANKTLSPTSRPRVSSVLSNNGVKSTPNNNSSSNNSVSNGPVTRNNILLSKSSSTSTVGLTSTSNTTSSSSGSGSSTNTTTTTMPVVRCAKIDQYFFRDS